MTRSVYVHSVLLFWIFYRTYESTRRHIPENLHLQQRQCDNLKSRLGLALYLKLDNKILMNYHSLISVKVVKRHLSRCHLTAPYQNIKLTISTTSSQEPLTTISATIMWLLKCPVLRLCT